MSLDDQGRVSNGIPKGVDHMTEYEAEMEREGDA